MKNIFFVFLLLLSGLCFGQSDTMIKDSSTVSVQASENLAPPVEMASALQASGKIYVVVAVLLIILAGIVVFLMRLDRKLGKLEEKMKS